MVNRQELIENERARRARKRAARAAAAADPVETAWALLGVQGTDTVDAIRSALRPLVTELPPGSGHGAVLHGALTGPPSIDLPEALRVTLAELPPAQLVANLVVLGQAGVPWFSELGLIRAMLLAEERPTVQAVGRLPEALLSGSAAWRRYLAVLGHPVRLTGGELAESCAALPLSLVDDLIDNGQVGAGDRPWERRADPREADYLAARLVPDQITSAQAAALGWPEAVSRHAYLAGAVETGDAVLDALAALYEGDNSDLFELRAALPAEQQANLRAVLDGVPVGRWPAWVTADRGLWRLLAAQWSAQAAADGDRDRWMDPRASDFHLWNAFRSAHERIVRGDLAGAVRQSDALSAFSAAEEPPALYDLEIRNLRAYLMQRPQGPEHRSGRLDLAVELLDADHPVISANRRLVEARLETPVNERESWENPFFVLGLTHGDPAWNERWRALTVEHRDDVDESARINDAWRRIHDAVGASGFFALPVEPGVIDVPAERSAVLVPSLAPLARRTATDESDLAPVRAGAAADLLDEFGAAEIDMTSEGGPHPR
ncbi:hypothetical protein [Actinomadura parmotrematis]|uniref:Uncharacterized protein n=1 Tax=Actinomadura parmotrematis TaxID=2864039 RepID=A0ABS7FU57_9ACTN|nr:hypothetical protein [Actinomadura parmotrematis]MBW8483947.1 hypothetical protein [Actinomadura parmotrematis]